MPVLINFKICDNCDACDGITVCPTKAFNWNKEKKTLEIDKSKCINCGLCATSPESCKVGAIKFARNEEEYLKLKQEIENDKRTIADLMVDRYGSQPINIPFYCMENEIEKILTTSKICMIEVYEDATTECLIKSIPIKELIKNIKEEVLYRKLEVQTNEFMKRYDINVLPSLLFFKDGKIIGKVDGYYDETQKEKLIEKVCTIIGK